MKGTQEAISGPLLQLLVVLLVSITKVATNDYYYQLLRWSSRCLSWAPRCF
jgi:hypothetical protein